jgi:exopolyphosphatase/guanosine-5'-triphosphate,3'-diphosphate pyrophosphatase
MNGMKDKRLVSVIDIGSIAIRIIVAEIDSEGDWQILDRSERSVPLGRDVFSTGNISRQTLLQCLKILTAFREMLQGWKIEGDDIRVLATSALREARNRDTFLDRVEMRTGFTVEVIEGIEENRLTYLAVQHSLKDHRPALGKTNSLIMEVGGGSTEVMLLQRGEMVAAHSLSVGTVRIEPALKAFPGSFDLLERFLSENVRTTLEVLDAELDLKRIKHFVAVGGDARLVARMVGAPGDRDYSLIEKPAFDEFIGKLRSVSIEDCVNMMQISYDDAESMIPALLMYRLFMEGTSATQLVVPNVSIREGVLLSMAQGEDTEIQKEFASQIINSAVSLGRKFRFDEAHARHVAKLALSLFDQLQDDHGLDRFHRVLLEVAAILHDTGTFIRTSGHHKHSQYIVANSEIFGLHRDDLGIVSNVVRYHRKALPQPSHRGYVILPREQRMIVLKLSSMLRVADALDRGHMQRIKGFTVEERSSRLRLNCDHQGDISVEKFALPRKADMFQEVFGLRVVVE